MTGFGSGTFSNDRLSVTIEIKGVNQRFLELSVRMPHAYLALEDKIRQSIKQELHRGKVDVFVTVTELERQEANIRVDFANLTACKKALDEVNEKLFPQSTTTLGQITSLNRDWFIQEPPQIDAEACWPVFQEALSDALSGIVSMRDAEGANIKVDLLARTTAMEKMVEAIAERKDSILQQYEERLRKRIIALLDNTKAIPDEERLLQEVAIHADKVDFTEEVVRFRSHVVQLRRLLEANGDMGRKLDFLIQELNRETNTIGSKANDLDVTDNVLQLKNEIEKIREQIQNIE
jgi:uncharacterized protein (TIGR00255 family)